MAKSETTSERQARERRETKARPLLDATTARAIDEIAAEFARRDPQMADSTCRQWAKAALRIAALPRLPDQLPDEIARSRVELSALAAHPSAPRPGREDVEAAITEIQMLPRYTRGGQHVRNVEGNIEQRVDYGAVQRIISALLVSREVESDEQKDALLDEIERLQGLMAAMTEDFDERSREFSRAYDALKSSVPPVAEPASREAVEAAIDAEVTEAELIALPWVAKALADLPNDAWRRTVRFAVKPDNRSADYEKAVELRRQLMQNDMSWRVRWMVSLAATEVQNLRLRAALFDGPALACEGTSNTQGVADRLASPSVRVGAESPSASVPPAPVAADQVPPPAASA